MSREFNKPFLSAGSNFKLRLLTHVCPVVLCLLVLWTVARFALIQIPPLVSAAPPRVSTNQFLDTIGNSLINLHEVSQGGWRFKSAIQAPHYQTDRDVGAASVGMGFLSLAKLEPQNPAWLAAAKNTATWLMAVSRTDQKGGRYWPDYVDDQQTSPDLYTSFDDGTLGISDFFWQLYEQSGDTNYRTYAIQGLEWTFSQAESYQINGATAYRWRWNSTDPTSPYYMGMGEGVVGLVTNFATYYQRLRNTDPIVAAQCQSYVYGALNYMNAVQNNLLTTTGEWRVLPETAIFGQEGDTTLNSGYLSGAAGEASMYLNLYKVFNNPVHLTKAEAILSWLMDNQNGPLVNLGNNTVTWKLSLDSQAGNDNQNATGVEEGNAGIGWVFLQAYNQTQNKTYLTTASQAADWLLQVAVKDSAGALSWHEDENPTNPLIHANLDNGTAGIGIFLQDMYLTTGQAKYHTGAVGALLSLTETAKYNGTNIYWNDNGGSSPYAADPSWHWGLAGNIDFVQRLNGGKLDIPGEQPSP